MNLTRRLGSGRGRLSLRSRLLAGLITVTALFLIIMGVVTTVVLAWPTSGVAWTLPALSVAIE